MKRVRSMLGIAIAAVALWGARRVSAQETEHLQARYGDYFRVSQTDSDLLGVGARLSFPILHRVKLEGEMAYDFSHAFTEGFTDTGTGLLSVERTDTESLGQSRNWGMVNFNRSYL